MSGKKVPYLVDSAWPFEQPLRWYRSMAVLMVDFLAARHGLSVEEYYKAYNEGKCQTPGVDLISHDQLMRFTGVDPTVEMNIRLLREHGEPILAKILKLGMLEEHYFDP